MIKNILDKNNIAYKIIDEEGNTELLKINNKLHMLYIHNRGNRFQMERDFFEYLDGNSIPYVIVCCDDLNNTLYYLKLNKEVNWVKSCFATCDKDAIYLGKQVLNCKILNYRLYLSARPLSHADLSLVSMPGVMRQDQLPSAVPGRFMRCWPSSPSTSCMAIIAMRASEA